MQSVSPADIFVQDVSGDRLMDAGTTEYIHRLQQRPLVDIGINEGLLQ